MTEIFGFCKQSNGTLRPVNFFFVKSKAGSLGMVPLDVELPHKIFERNRVDRSNFLFLIFEKKVCWLLALGASVTRNSHQQISFSAEIFFDIYRLGNRTSSSQKIQTEAGLDGLYDSSVETVVATADLESPTTINCIFSLPGTNYTKKRETIYYGKIFFICFIRKKYSLHTQQATIWVGIWAKYRCY